MGKTCKMHEFEHKQTSNVRVKATSRQQCWSHTVDCFTKDPPKLQRKIRPAPRYVYPNQVSLRKIKCDTIEFYELLTDLGTNLINLTTVVAEVIIDPNRCGLSHNIHLSFIHTLLHPTCPHTIMKCM